MIAERRASAQRWLVVATATVGLLAAILVLVVRYYEIRRARAEAARAEAESTVTRRSDLPVVTPVPPVATPVPPTATTSPAPVAEPAFRKYAEYNAFATGPWLRPLTGPGDLPEKSPTVRFKADVLELKRDSVLISGFQAKDAIIRAFVMKADGKNVTLALRHSRDGFYTAWFNGDEFGVGRWDRGAKKMIDIKAARPPRRHDGFFEFAFAAVGNKLSVYANGRLALQVRDASVAGPGEAKLGANEALGLFRDVEVQSLDAR